MANPIKIAMIDMLNALRSPHILAVLARAGLTIAYLIRKLFCHL